MEGAGGTFPQIHRVQLELARRTGTPLPPVSKLVATTSAQLELLAHQTGAPLLAAALADGKSVNVAPRDPLNPPRSFVSATPPPTIAAAAAATTAAASSRTTPMTATAGVQRPAPLKLQAPPTNALHSSSSNSGGGSSKSSTAAAAPADLMQYHAGNAGISAKGPEAARKPAGESGHPSSGGMPESLNVVPTPAPAHVPPAADLPINAMFKQKHAMLSYQWDNQDNVTRVRGLLEQAGVRCWIDIDGGMQSDIYDSMAEGVQGAACVICFMTPAYQDSANCKLELKFAQQSGVPIIPVMVQKNWRASDWLGIITAGALWTPISFDLKDSGDFGASVGKLVAQIQKTLVPPARTGTAAAQMLASSDSELSSDEHDIDFSVAEMRDELERLKSEIEGIATKGGGGAAAVSALCTVPAAVPQLPVGIQISAEMTALLRSVLSSDSSDAQQIGFNGMGGIGKTTISSWVARDTVSPCRASLHTH